MKIKVKKVTTPIHVLKLCTDEMVVIYKALEAMTEAGHDDTKGTARFTALADSMRADIASVGFSQAHLDRSLRDITATAELIDSDQIF